jgi:tRNA/rRNA methyltransferase
VPSNPAFPSLNLAQCVLLLAYEWRRAAGRADGVEIVMAGTDWATEAERAALAGHWEERLDRAGFFFPPARAAAMRRSMRNFWSRMPLTTADIGLLHGVMRQMSRWAMRSDGDAPGAASGAELPGSQRGSDDR